MHLLVPPLDDSCCRGSDFGGSSSGTLEETGNSGKKRNSRSATRSAMSQGLQQQFETMKQAWNASRPAAGNRSESTSAESSIEENRSREDHQNKKRRVAIETAFAIESEVQKWQRGVAELEAMLDEEGNAPRSSSSSMALRPPAVVRFPSLPPIVPAEEGDFEKSADDDDEEEESQNIDHCTNTNDEQTDEFEQSLKNKKDAITSTE